jgi:hypothetical protein
LFESLELARAKALKGAAHPIDGFSTHKPQLVAAVLLLIISAFATFYTA